MKANALHDRSSHFWSRLKRALSKPAIKGEQKHSAQSFYSAIASQTYIQTPGKPVWMGRDYQRFADEGYIKNVIAHRAVNLISEGAASVPWILFDGGKQRISEHPLLRLLNQPNPLQGGAELFQSIYAGRLIAGNAYLQVAGPNMGTPKELHALRPDRVSVIAGKNGMPAGYRYTVGDSYQDYPIDGNTGRARILHLKSYHPLNDWYGLSPIEPAAYSIDQHNQSGAWNQALLQNGARPSGALVVNLHDHSGGSHLSEEQYSRIRQQIDEQFAGPANAGRPLLLEGGLEWREMSMTPKDMDFIEAKHSAARDIALAFGVPPQLIGIPGDNTYSNLAEARLALWEQTILPLVDGMCDALNNWLIPQFGGKLELHYDTDGISALSIRREKVWQKVNNATFLSDEEKRELVGMTRRGGGHAE